MTGRKERSRMLSLVDAYHKLLRRNGLGWLLKENQKVAVLHVLSAVKPRTLCYRLQSDLEFSQHGLKKHLCKFMAHAVKVSEAFQLIDVGPQLSNNCKGKRKGTNNQSGDKETSKENTPSDSSNSTSGSACIKSKRSAPECLFHTCKGLYHWVRDCPGSTAEETQQMFDNITASNAKGGPARPTRGLKKSDNFSVPETTKGTTKAAGTTGRLVPAQAT
eukprot:GFKZ01013345.1.p1 GENE.GFKZ01013345.1~~GFKZ01013345.1.p1  ORF type:complete len:218 (+),score=13.70 GFKZ01013345.1:592-1245(+)